MTSTRARVSQSDGMTLWHRLQRSWPMTQTRDEVDETLASPRIISLFPNTTRDRFGIHVQLHKIKQGTYHAQRATLATFRVTLNPTRDFTEACVEIRLRTCQHRSNKEQQAPPCFVGAYGPACIKELYSGNDGDIPAGVQMSRIPRGVLAIVRSRVPERDIIPHVFDLGVIVVHEQAVQLKVLPSTIDCQRAKALRRTKVYPIRLSRNGDSGSLLVTCGQGEGGCHPTCDNFDAAHMTPEAWKGLLGRRNVEIYDAQTMEDWVTYV